MVALSALIVIAKDTLATHDKGKPVFVPMAAARHGFGRVPQNDFLEGLIGEILAIFL